MRLGRAQGAGDGSFGRALSSTLVADLDKRRSYTPRRVRERRAYQLAVTGGVAGAIGVIGAVLALAGVIGAGLPIVALVIAGVCAFLFRRAVVG